LRGLRCNFFAPQDVKNKYRYNGKEFIDDFEIGLYDYGARWYNPAIGRFMSVDPLADEYAAWTPYHYVHNNPIRLTDPDGREAEDEFIRSWNKESKSYDYVKVSNEGGDDYDIIHTVNGSIPENNATVTTEVKFNTTGGERIAPGEFGEGFSLPSSGGKGLESIDLSDFTGKGLFKGVAKFGLGLFVTKVLKEGGKEMGGVLVRKAVNTGMSHAVERGVVRSIFKSKSEATSLLKDLSKRIAKEGFPKGAFKDPSYVNRILVPIGNKGLASYKISKNGNAVLKTVLNAR